MRSWTSDSALPRTLQHYHHHPVDSGRCRDTAMGVVQPAISNRVHFTISCSAAGGEIFVKILFWGLSWDIKLKFLHQIYHHLALHQAPGAQHPFFPSVVDPQSSLAPNSLLGFVKCAVSESLPQIHQTCSQTGCHGAARAVGTQEHQGSHRLPFSKDTTDPLN